MHVRPTRHLERGLRPGYIYELNLRDPWVKRQLAIGALVLLTEDGHDAEDAPEETAAAPHAPLTSPPGDELGNDTETPLPPLLPDGPDG